MGVSNISIEIGNVIKFKLDGIVVTKKLSDDVWNDITPLSAVGSRLIGKKVGDKFLVHIPIGVKEVEILEVS